MNKNTVIGFVLIGLILIGFSWYNTKIFKEQERERFVADSIARVEALKNAPKIDSAIVALNAVPFNVPWKAPFNCAFFEVNKPA